MAINLDLTPLNIHDIIKVARLKEPISLNEKVLSNLQPSLDFIQSALSQNKIIYGITTGFGPLKDMVVRPEDSSELSHNIILSHSAGTGDPVAEDIIRATILIRINSLIQGYSGIKVDTIEALTELLNKNIYPHVPQYGSVGASGDLAPICHICTTIIGHGKIFDRSTNQWISVSENNLPLPKVQLGPKEGLALSNGTSFSAALSALNCFDAHHLAELADIATALSLEAFTGTTDAFDPKIHQVRGQKGQIQVAANIRKLVAGSSLVHSQPGAYSRVQDAYSLRCVPQVHGACRDSITFATQITNTEINAATDNPLIFPEQNQSLSGGNFHAEYMAMAMSTLAIAVAEFGNISERRTARLVDMHLNNDLPAFLIAPEKVGLHSGFMIPQYTGASLVAANKVLAHPATVDSIPTSANQEDHVSFAPTVGFNTRTIIDNVLRILAIEIYTTCQAIDFRGADKLGYSTRAAYDLVREQVTFLSEDRVMSDDIERIYQLIKTPEFVAQVTNPQPVSQI